MQNRKTQPPTSNNNPNSQLVEELLNENQKLKQQHESLKKEHLLLRKKYDLLCHQVPAEIVEQIDQKAMKKYEDEHVNSPRYGRKWDEEMEEMEFDGEQKEEQSMEEAFVGMKANNYRRSRSSSISECPKSFPLIEGCFILEKKPLLATQKSKHIAEMMEFCYPEDLLKHEKQTIDLLLKYSFSSYDYLQISDDQFSSRRNQITFGTPYEDFMYGFEDSRWNNKKELPDIMREMGTLKKKYYHVMIRPEIIENQELQGGDEEEEKEEKEQGGEKEGEQSEGDEKPQNFYQTSVIYCFISSFPLRTHFQDLHRVVQQQLKYKIFNEKQSHFKDSEEMSKQEEGDALKQPPNSLDRFRKQKYTLAGEIMKDIYESKCLIKGFPIFHTYYTGVTKLEINIPTVKHYHEIEDEYLKNVLHKYRDIKICRLLHYILAERFVMVTSASNKVLNEVFEIVRLIIRPFIWIFATVYRYDKYFEPFLSSPMPIIIGKLLKEESSQQSEGSESEQESAESQFLTVAMDSNIADTPLKQSEPFSKSIKRLKKHMQKTDDKVGLIHKYVSHLRNFIEKGILDQEPTDFHMEFIETQMVSYFKDGKES